MFRPAPYVYEDLGVIHPLSEEALGARFARANGLANFGSGTNTANLAIFVPFGVSQPFLVREVFWGNGSGVMGNVDVGIYDTAGNRLASLGSTSQGAASTIVTSTTWTDYQLAPGDYYMAYVSSSTTNGILVVTGTTSTYSAFGLGQLATALPLPNPATITTSATTILPFFGLNGYTVAA